MKINLFVTVLTSIVVLGCHAKTYHANVNYEKQPFRAEKSGSKVNIFDGNKLARQVDGDIVSMQNDFVIYRTSDNSYGVYLKGQGLFGECQKCTIEGQNIYFMISQEKPEGLIEDKFYEVQQDGNEPKQVLYAWTKNRKELETHVGPFFVSYSSKQKSAVVLVRRGLVYSTDGYAKFESDGTFALHIHGPNGFTKVIDNNSDQL